jgi:hypothetical protein
MLKCSVKPLLTLVLALVATSLLSTLCPAREFRHSDSSPVTGVTDNVKQRPGVSSGEPDTPSSPPPVRLNTGIPVPMSPDQDSGEVYYIMLRWTGWVWAFWYFRAAI